jgi:hypothetical protein
MTKPLELGQDSTLLTHPRLLAACTRPLVHALTVVSTRDGPRVKVIDGARGLFVSWMIVAHALTLAGIAEDHLLQMLRPRGWATTCFIALTGFSLGVLVEWSPADGRARSWRLRRRALQIGVAAYLSNVLYRAGEAALDGHLSAAYLLRLATFREAWSISAILLPTSLFLAASPALLRATAGLSPVRLFALATGAMCLFDLAQHGVPTAGWVAEVNGWLFRSGGNFHFPIALYVLYATWSYALGRLVKAAHGSRGTWPLLLTAAIGLLAPQEPLAGLFALRPPFLRVAGRFVVGIQLAALLQRAGRLVPVGDFLSTLGQAALLVFLLHRVVLQILHRLLPASLQPALLALALMASTLAACYLIAAGRQRCPRFAAALQRLGL